MDTVERIFALIEEKGVTAADVAKEVDLPKSSFTDWKKGRSKPSADALAKLADYFDVSVDYLLGRSNLREPLTTIAAHTDDPEGIPPEAQEEIFEFIEFVKHKYGIGKKGEGE
jgi:transcriptional regulator with XRE-family HTH domain